MKPDDFDLCIDTALSWDGAFPDPGEGDYVVTFETPDGPATVLVSSRYTAANDADEAAEIARDALCERRAYAETDVALVSCQAVDA